MIKYAFIGQNYKMIMNSYSQTKVANYSRFDGYCFLYHCKELRMCNLYAGWNGYEDYKKYMKSISKRKTKFKVDII